jgi:hypothetical protein
MSFELLTAASKKRSGGASSAYTVWDPTSLQTGGVLSGDNLTITTEPSATYTNATATQGKIAGKWYFEIKSLSSGSSGALPGIADFDFGDTDQYVGAAGGAGNSAGLNWDNTLYSDGFTIANNISGGTFAQFDTWCVAVDIDNKQAWIYRNGDDGIGDPNAGTNPSFTWVASWTIYPAFSCYTGYGARVHTANFGATPFEYTVPTGFNPGWYI